MLSWRKYQRRLQLSRWLKKILFFGAAGVVLLAGLGLYRGFRWLASPPQQSSQFWQEQSAWGGRHQLNLWLPEGDLFLALNPNSTQPSLRLFQLNKGQKPSQAYLFADAYLLWPNQPPECFREWLKRPHPCRVSLGNLLAARTNLSRRQLFKIWWLLRKVKPSEITPSTNFSEEAIRAERLKVIVLNATNRPGLAREAARWVENLGAEVIAVGNSDVSLDQSQANQIKAYNIQEGSWTLKRLEQIFRTSAELIHTASPPRADIVITVKILPTAF